MSGDEPIEQPRRRRGCDYGALTDALVFRFVDILVGSRETPGTRKVGAAIDELNCLMNEGFSREQGYPIFAEALSRGFVTLTPPWELALAQRIMDRYRLKPLEQKVWIPDVNGHYGAALNAIALGAAHLINEIVPSLAVEGRVETGLGTGNSVLQAVRASSDLLRSANGRRLHFYVYPIEPSGYAAAFPGTSPVSFARLLEALPRHQVTIHPRPEKAVLQLLVLDAHEPEAAGLLAGVESQNLVLLVGPGDIEPVLPWFERQRAFTHAVVDSGTAMRLVATE